VQRRSCAGEGVRAGLDGVPGLVQELADVAARLLLPGCGQGYCVVSAMSGLG
jgi:hypothetical protein